MAIGTTQTKNKVLDAFRHADQRTALRGINNRILGGTSGSSNVTAGLAVGTAGTKGVGWAIPVSAVIDGLVVALPATPDVVIPALGVQPGNVFCKYLVYAKSGSANVAKGNEAATLAAAYLPDLPDGFVPVGYFVVNSTAGTWTAGAGITTGTATITYVDLICMPIDG
jgi:hypothetical protein